MIPRFYDPFDENAPSFIELNKRRRSHLDDERLRSMAKTALQKHTEIVSPPESSEPATFERSGSFDQKKARNAKWPEIEPIWNRRDQTSPEAYVIYVFLNGNGLCCRNVSFTRLQLEVGGLRHVMELIAREYNVRPKMLVRLDGTKVDRINELTTRGAYVLIQAGEKFHECWYFLPDYAVDTSISPDRMLVRRKSSVGVKMATPKRTQVTEVKRDGLFMP